MGTPMAEGEKHWHEVLVVEDDRDVRDAISHLLGFQAFTVRSASDGRQAIAHLRDGYRPCLILLDLTMPGMDGEAFCHEQREIPDCAEIPVVIVSGREDGRQLATKLSAVLFLPKPLGVAKLLAAIERHCRRSPR